MTSLKQIEAVLAFHVCSCSRCRFFTSCTAPAPVGAYAVPAPRKKRVLCIRFMWNAAPAHVFEDHPQHNSSISAGWRIHSPGSAMCVCVNTLIAPAQSATDAAPELVGYNSFILGAVCTAGPHHFFAVETGSSFNPAVPPRRFFCNAHRTLADSH